MKVSNKPAPQSTKVQEPESHRTSGDTQPTTNRATGWAPKWAGKQKKGAATGSHPPENGSSTHPPRATGSEPPTQRQGSASTSAGASPSAAPGALPFIPRTDLGPRVSGQFMSLHQNLSVATSALEECIGQMPPGVERDRVTPQLARIKKNLNSFGGLLAGSPEAGAHLNTLMGPATDGSRMALLSERLRTSISDLSLSLHQGVLPKVQQFDQLQPLVENMMEKVAHEQLTALEAWPLAYPGRNALREGLRTSVGEMKQDVKLAKSEVAMQGRVLDTLGAAVTGVGQADVEGSHGAGRNAGKLLGSQLSNALHIDPRRANVRVSDQINQGYGQFFQATPDGKKEFGVVPDPDVKGKLSNKELLGALDEGLAQKKRGQGMNVVKTGTRLAVDASPDLELGGPHPGERRKTQHANLAPETAAELERLRRPGAPVNMAPVDRLANVGMHASEARKLGDLRLSLLQSFGPDIANQIEETDSLLQLRPKLSGNKAVLLHSTFEKLMGCSNKEEMNSVISDARIQHQAVLRDAVAPASGGRTATVLNEMEEAINRFFSS